MASSSPTSRKPSKKPKPEGLQAYGTDKTSSASSFLQENLLGEDDEDEIEKPIFDSVRPRPQRQTSSDISPKTQKRFAADGSSRLIVAVDYGTTFTGVAWAVTSSESAILDEVETITDWGAGMSNAGKVPSVVSYSPSNDQQWGANISGDSIAMVNTKMELDVQENKIDELELILQLLHGTDNLDFETVRKSRGYPAYTFKTPEEIVADYLSEIFKHVNKFFDERIQTEAFGSSLKEKIPVDLVLTVPVNWSYRAKNATLRAVRHAGFNEDTFKNLNDMILVTEPEAAALYTARHLKEDKHTEFLKLGECFVLCDAGGGTVDCVSYKVTQLEPLALEKMSVATSAKCGSSYIDSNFKWWLRGILGERHYRLLDPRSSGLRSQTSEGRFMRALMKDFDLKKKAFVSRQHGRADDIIIDMPEGQFDRLHIPNRLRDGELTISHDEMRAFFDPCVDGVVELIQGQIQQVERTRNRVKNVFLVGGFAESPYLQEELAYSLELRKIKMRKPDKFKAWTAVVQGAVMYGIEKAEHKKLTLMSTCARSYGVALNEVYSPIKYNKKDQYLDPVTNCEMAQQQITWLVRRGDLILSDDKKVVEKEFLFHFKDGDERKFSLPVYEYPDEDDDVPERFATGENELVKAAVLNCDLSSIPVTQFESYKNPQDRKTFYIAYLICKVILSGPCLEVEIHMKGKKICSTKIKDVQHGNFGSSADSDIYEDDPWSIPSMSSARGSQSSSSTSRTQRRVNKRSDNVRMTSDPTRPGSNWDDFFPVSRDDSPTTVSASRRSEPSSSVGSRVDLLSSLEPKASSRRRSGDPTREKPEPLVSLDEDEDDLLGDLGPVTKVRTKEKSPMREKTPPPVEIERERSPAPSENSTKKKTTTTSSSTSGIGRKDTTLGRFRSVPDFYLEGAYASGAFIAELPAEPVPKIPGTFK